METRAPKVGGRTVPGSAAALRRRPRAGGYARGDKTRDRIIGAALEIFGEQGFGGASTRQIAERAGVSLPALQYYFDGKEGAYLACADHIAEQMSTRLSPPLAGIAARLAQAPPSRREARRMLGEFLDGFAGLFLGERALDNWVLFMIREQAHPTRAFDVLFDRVIGRVAGACAALVGVLLGRPAEDPQTRIATMAVLGQVIIFRTARATALRVLGWRDFDGARLRQARQGLRAHIAATLAGIDTRKRSA